ncbi:hypothetical protein P9D34_19380 [Bacillus swezeyi]|uniref:Uncharacterized protein n=1 Tax=Bacillus swezeyi TaxID=1925020 RepID=A0A1R1QFM6_9BACI|nr:hypothetical protein [Bacillus swezeyi]MEC1262546.1 hypothetical protein [Bacillus swezeyi]MED2926745.1 hypothetical protein [Bacillus swezeyi]MED2943476.1 hypothetical protein [Bacillus swezeyi]MED2965693.1 hypothetical protein [Bacillus swezeyi]MED2978383.1 hypothetical protein [Bacillus swezeyi]
MKIFKDIVVGFAICHFLFLILLYLNLYRRGAFHEWLDTIPYAFILFSYIPLLALIEYFAFLWMLKKLNVSFLTALLVGVANGAVLYLHSNEMFMGGIAGVSAFFMGLALRWNESRRKTVE